MEDSENPEWALLMINLKALRILKEASHYRVEWKALLLTTVAQMLDFQ